MAESLQRLVDIETFTVLQDKLQRWNQTYDDNTADENLARACEIVELNARVQGQLFKLLSLCASEGRLYGSGAAGIKSRLLPLLGQGFFASGLSSDASLSVIADAASKEREVAEVRRSCETSLQELEAELARARAEAEDVKAELADTKQELERQGRASASEKMFSDAELQELRHKLTEADAERLRLQSRADLVDDYDRQVRYLRDEITDLHARRDLLYGPPPLPPPCCYPSSMYPTPLPPLPSPLPPTSSYEDRQLARSIDSHLAFHGRPPVSPLSPADPLQRSRRQALAARYHDLSTVLRLDAMEALRRCYDDQENNQRIVFAAVQEAFALSKLAFREFKARVRSQLLLSHIGPASLEETVQDYINCHHKPEDLTGLTQDVTRALSRNHRLYLPPGIGYEMIGVFIREACQLAWEMATLATPMEVARGREGEVFDELKYRRSYNSEFSAPLVSHHIWPALVTLDGEVVAKGEAYTRRGAAYSQRARSSSRSGGGSRSQSPACRRQEATAQLAHDDSRSRTPRTGKEAAAAAAAAAVDTDRGTARTASTALSHYAAV